MAKKKITFTLPEKLHKSFKSKTKKKKVHMAVRLRELIAADVKV